jgi:hypothetical protein
MLEDIPWYHGSYDNWKTDICALYEPYKGEYYVTGPTQDPRDKPLFQPGFTYRFVACDYDCDQPNICDYPKECEDYNFSYTNNSVLTISKYETDYSIITHPNHTAIEIDFVAPLPVLTPNTRRCYNNWNRAADGGSVIQFNDNIFNNNITITPQDSTSINSPSLIDGLQPGLYKVEKVFNDGAIQETVIIKENED